MYTDRPTEATGGAAASGARKSSSSSIEDEDDFLAVVAPEMPADDGQPEGFINKMKRWCSWLYYYIAISVDKVIDVLNDISKDYREIADQLKRERKEKRIDKLRRAKFGYGGVRGRHGEASDPEADTKVRVDIYLFFNFFNFYSMGFSIFFCLSFLFHCYSLYDKGRFRGYNFVACDFCSSRCSRHAKIVYNIVCGYDLQ